MFIFGVEFQFSKMCPDVDLIRERSFVVQYNPGAMFSFFEDTLSVNH